MATYSVDIIIEIGDLNVQTLRQYTTPIYVRPLRLRPIEYGSADHGHRIEPSQRYFLCDLPRQSGHGNHFSDSVLTDLCTSVL